MGDIPAHFGNPKEYFTFSIGCRNEETLRCSQGDRLFLLYAQAQAGDRIHFRNK